MVTKGKVTGNWNWTPINDLAPELVRSLLSYDPETGIVTHKAREEKTRFDVTWNKRFAGRAATVLRGHYRYISMFKRSYSVSRIAWVIHYGKWPKEFIDHINGDKLDNRICNLRDVTRQQNTVNTSVRKNSATQIKGVSYREGRRLRWCAKIRANGKQTYLGSYLTANEAAAAYAKAAKEYFGEYARIA
jgi:hypothetical protein